MSLHEPYVANLYTATSTAASDQRKAAVQPTSDASRVAPATSPVASTSASHELKAAASQTTTAPESTTASHRRRAASHQPKTANAKTAPDVMSSTQASGTGFVTPEAAVDASKTAPTTSKRKSTTDKPVKDSSTANKRKCTLEKPPARISTAFNIDMTTGKPVTAASQENGASQLLTSAESAAKGAIKQVETERNLKADAKAYAAAKEESEGYDWVQAQMDGLGRPVVVYFSEPKSTLERMVIGVLEEPTRRSVLAAARRPRGVDVSRILFLNGDFVAGQKPTKVTHRAYVMKEDKDIEFWFKTLRPERAMIFVVQSQRDGGLRLEENTMPVEGVVRSFVLSKVPSG